MKKNFLHRTKKIRLATSFSGIGAIEHAFQWLGLKHEIVFAGDIDAKVKEDLKILIFLTYGKIMLIDFVNYLENNTSLSDSSINHYESGVRTISKQMLKSKVISKPLEEMEIVDLEIALFLILLDETFLKKDSTGNKMYSNALKQYQAFAKSTKENKAKSLEDAVKNDSSLKPTEKETIIKARIGQGDFRKSLIEKYAGKCIITGINDTRLLVASHIKPWSVSNNQERIDVENGFLLSPLYDKMFDLGIITFTNDGIIKCSTTLSQNNKSLLKIDALRKYNLRISSKMIENLDYHRECIFLK